MKTNKIFKYIAISIFVIIVISALITVIESRAVSSNKVAIVTIKGPILEANNIVNEIKDYVKDKSIKAIVIRVDSPGGGVVPSQEIYEQIKKAVSKKIVVVSMGSLAASGGYYVSAPATKIIANQGTITGSIGVIMEIPNIKGLMDKVGIKTEVIKSGKHKDLASIFRDMGNEERKIIQNVISDVHGQFIKAVSESRKMPEEDIRKIADGRIFSGNQAKELGLVDEIGDFQYAIERAAKLSEIKGEPDIVIKEEKNSLLRFLKNNFSGKLSKILLPNESKHELKYMFVP